MVITAPHDDAATQALYGLIALVTDPAASKARIDELKETQRQASESLAQAKESAAVLEAREKSIADREAAVQKREDDAARASQGNVAESTRLEKVKSDLDRKAAKLQTEQDAFERSRKQTSDQLLQRESALSVRESKVGRVEIERRLGN